MHLLRDGDETLKTEHVTENLQVGVAEADDPIAQAHNKAAQAILNGLNKLVREIAVADKEVAHGVVSAALLLAYGRWFGSTAVAAPADLPLHEQSMLWNFYRGAAGGFRRAASRNLPENELVIAVASAEYCEKLAQAYEPEQLKRAKETKQ